MVVQTINQQASELLDAHRVKFSDFDVQVSRLPGGAELFDFGHDRRGTTEAGVLLARICLADLAQVRLGDAATPFSASVEVQTDQPLVSCMASQYAGWPISIGKYFAMCSGPARSARGKEKVLDQYDLCRQGDGVVAVLESDRLPGDEVAGEIAAQCDVEPKQLQICVARTASLPGTIQVTARSVETAMHKLHELGFDLKAVRKGTGTAPLPRIADDDLCALGWTNDAMLYGANVELEVDCDDQAVEAIGSKIPSSSSSDFGKPFIEIFERYGRDFYKIDPMLFSPARITIRNVSTGSEFVYGEIRDDILIASWNL